MANGRRASAPNPSTEAAQVTLSQTRGPCQGCHNCNCGCGICSCRTKPVPNYSSTQHYKGEGGHFVPVPEDDIVLTDPDSRYPASVSSVDSSGAGSLVSNNSVEVREYTNPRLTSTNLARLGTHHQPQAVREALVMDDEDLDPWGSGWFVDSSGMIGAETMEIDSLRPGIGSGNASMFSSQYETALTHLSHETLNVTGSQMVFGAGGAFGSQIHQFLSLTPECRHVRAIPMCRHCGHH